MIGLPPSPPLDTEYVELSYEDYRDSSMSELVKTSERDSAYSKGLSRQAFLRTNQSYQTYFGVSDIQDIIVFGSEPTQKRFRELVNLEHKTILEEDKTKHFSFTLGFKYTSTKEEVKGLLRFFTKTLIGSKRLPSLEEIDMGRHGPYNIGGGSSTAQIVVLSKEELLDSNRVTIGAGKFPLALIHCLYWWYCATDKGPLIVLILNEEGGVLKTDISLPKVEYHNSTFRGSIVAEITKNGRICNSRVILEGRVRNGRHLEIPLSDIYHSSSGDKVETELITWLSQWFTRLYVITSDTRAVYCEDIKLNAVIKSLDSIRPKQILSKDSLVKKTRKRK